SELFALVTAAEKATGIPAKELVHKFGVYMLPHFVTNYPIFFEGQTSLKEFLLTVDEVIHVEVRKLYPDAGLPEFAYENREDNELVMLYSSPRKLCALAEGLIEGSAKHFKQTCLIKHDICMHNDSDHCRFELQISEPLE
ncbi:MAG: heme NO-binding domain-containing protein, partial [Pseudomonadales bacterium]